MNSGQFNTEKHSTILIEGCDALGISLSAAQQEKLIDHIDLLAKWNKRLNLTAITARDDMIVQHILDSLAIHPHIVGDQVLDVGSGAGFPGIPLAIVFPDLQITLLDSRGKRVTFLRHVATTLGLGNISLVNSRLEDYRPPSKFDTLTARAFSSLPDLIKLSQGVIADGTRVLGMKGKYPKEEIASLEREIRNKLTVHKLGVPFLNAQRNLIIIDF